MTASSSDFILDEGLDDDEEVLVFHSQHHDSTPSDTKPSHLSPTETTSSPAQPAPAPLEPPPHPPIQAVIIDGMPLSSSRTDLDAFLTGTGLITRIQLRRLEALAILRARVTFENSEAAALALKKDGLEFSPGGAVVSVKYDSVERWEQGCGKEGRGKPRSEALMQIVPARETVTSSFWAAFGVAKRAAERFEQSAKRLGDKLEERLAVSEKVDGAAEALERVDKQLQVSQRVGETAAAGRSTVGELDRMYGISKGVGKFMDEVGRGAKIVAREVDENLQLSDRAREVTNRALNHDGIGPTVRNVVDNVGGKGVAGESTPRKNYRPSGVAQNSEDGDFGGVAE